MNDQSTLEAPSEQIAWDDALAAYLAADAAYNEAIALEEASAEAVDEDVPRPSHLFDLGLHMGIKSHQMALDRLRWHEVLYDKSLNAEKLADEWMRHIAAHEEAERRYNTAELNAKVKSAGDVWTAARDTLLAIPAPDVAGLLAKLRITLTYNDQDDLLAESERLLGN